MDPAKRTMKAIINTVEALSKKKKKTKNITNRVENPSRKKTMRTIVKNIIKTVEILLKRMKTIMMEANLLYNFSGKYI